MGCCFSSSAASKPDQNRQNDSNPHHFPHKAPSFPSAVKEKVKEVLVLSNTPLIQIKPQEKTLIQPSQESKAIAKPFNPIRRCQLQLQKQESEASGDLSGLSEMYSASLSISTTTTARTVTKDTDDEATSIQSKSKRSPAKVPRKRPCNADLGSGVPARKLETQLEKRARGPRRGMGQSGDMRTMQRNLSSRSRSPATGRAAGVGTCRGLSVRRRPAKPTGKARGKSSSTEKEGCNSATATEGGKNGTVLEQLGNSTSSLENPNVSLECFIFL